MEAMNGELVIAARFADGVEVPIPPSEEEEAARQVAKLSQRQRVTTELKTAERRWDTCTKVRSSLGSMVAGTLAIWRITPTAWLPNQARGCCVVGDGF